jgi:hypothetical protein
MEKGIIVYFDASIANSSLNQDVLELYDAIRKDPRIGGHAMLRQTGIPGRNFRALSRISVEDSIDRGEQ